MSEIKATRTHFEQRLHNEEVIEKGLEAILNDIGWENVLQVLPCYCGSGEYFYTIIYKAFKEEGGTSD